MILIWNLNLNYHGMTMTDLLKTPTYSNKLYGRRWKVTVLVPTDKVTTKSTDDDSKFTQVVLSDSSKEDTSLRVTFNIKKQLGISMNMNEICVYNLNVATENLLIENGYRVRVEAGYIAGNYGLICDSIVFQPMWEREGNVTKKLTLHCIDGLDLIDQNWAITRGEKMQSQKNMVALMAGKSSIPIPVDIGEGCEDNKLVRTKIFCGSAMDYIRKYCQQSGTLPTVIGNKVSLVRLQDPVSPETQKNLITITAGTANSLGSLIGTPQQTQNGVDFTCLLNANITVVSPPNLVKLDNTIIRQIKINFGETKFANLDKDWTYRVVGVNHVGDTRGQDWYSKVTGVNQNMEGYLPLPYATPKHTSS